MSAVVPQLDGRSVEQILAALHARIPGYLPAWHTQARDPGGAALAVLARYRAILADGLNRAPDRMQLAFLETLGSSLLAGQAARVPLVFELLDTAPQDVTLPARSQVAAKLAPPPTSLGREGEAERRAIEAPRFFTTRTVSLVRARLAAFYSTDPSIDAYADHSTSLTSGFVAFDRFTGMSHELYLGHDELFALAGAAEITLSFDMAGGEPHDRLLALEWEYLSEDGWLALVVEDDTTQRFTRDGRVRLRKTCGPDAKRETIFGHESFWLRARISERPASARVVEISAQGVLLDRAGALIAGDQVTLDGERTATVTAALNRVISLDAQLPDMQTDAVLRVADTRAPLAAETEARLGPPPQVDLIRAKVGFTKTDLKIDKAFLNTTPLDVENVFYPFGLQPKTFDTLYLSSADAFSRPSAALEIEVTLKEPGAPGDDGLVLAFEYFDGTQWKALSNSLPTRLDDRTAGFTKSGKLVFTAPEDWSQCKVNGQQKHWLRVRIDSGDYGAPLRVSVTNDVNGNPVVTATAATLTPPAVAAIRVSYTYFTNSHVLDHCLAYNNFTFRDHSDDVRWTRRPFTPFLHNEDRDAALHLAFDQPLPPALISLFVDVPESLLTPTTSKLVWEYRTAEGWSELTVLDETAGLERRGMIQFIGPGDAARIEGKGGALYRIRARLKPGERIVPAPITAVWLNAVWGTQGEAVQQEIVGRSDGNPDQVLTVPAQRVPVLADEQVEVREWNGRGPGWRMAVEGVPEMDLRFERDAVTQEPRAVWVRWHPREHLLASGANDRHYTLERTSGRLQFGDGVCGRIPPGGAAVAISFVTGIGAAGNVPAHSITELRTGVAYLRGVTNPIAAQGGAAPESARAVVARGTQRARHRGRAIAASDYEWLAHEASPAVARAHCLPVTGEHGRAQAGNVTLLIVPHGSERQPVPSAELRRRVHEHVARYCPPAVAARLIVTDPRYVGVGVVAHVVLEDIEQAATVEAALRRRLDEWLHPVTGGVDGRGWPFGASLCLSQIATLVGAVPGIAHATRIALRADGACREDVLMLPPDVLPSAGAHEIKIELPST